MRYIGWGNERTILIEGRNIRVIDLYIFDSPELTEYDTGNIGVHPVAKRYVNFEIKIGIVPEIVRQYQDGSLSGVGIRKDRLFVLDEKLEKPAIAKQLGITEGQLESILSSTV